MSKRKAIDGLPPVPRRPDPPYLQWILRQVPPNTGDFAADQAAFRAFCPPIDTEQWDRCRSGVCEHHSPLALAWGHLLKQQPQAMTAGLAAVSENVALNQKVTALEAENWALRAEMERLHHAAQQSSRADEKDSEDSADEDDADEEEIEADEEEETKVAPAQLNGGDGLGHPRQPHYDFDLDPALRPSPQAQTIPPILPTTEAAETPFDPKDVYAVILRYDAFGNSNVCELKGVFIDLAMANETALAVCKQEFPNCDYAGGEIKDKGVVDEPWAGRGSGGGNDIGAVQRRYASSGEVSYAVDEENDGVGYVAVLRKELDAKPVLPDPAPTDAGALGGLPRWDRFSNAEWE